MMRRLLVGCFFVVACRRPSATTSSIDAAIATTPLADLSVTFHETSPGDYDLRLEPNRTLACTHGGSSATTKVCAFELEPFEAAVTAPGFAKAASTGAPTFDLHVASRSSTIDAKGDATSAAAKPVIGELEKLCTLASVKTAPFEIVYSRIEQGGTAGKHDVYEVRSDGAFTVKDAMSVVVRRGTAPVIEVAALARLVARPELAALGSTYVDPTPAPSVMETDYDLTIGKTTSLKGVFHDKTPSIIAAITSEIMRVTMLP